jgi:hypothetical protein
MAKACRPRDDSVSRNFRLRDGRWITKQTKKHETNEKEIQVGRLKGDVHAIRYCFFVYFVFFRLFRYPTPNLVLYL